MRIVTLQSILLLIVEQNRIFSLKVKKKFYYHIGRECLALSHGMPTIILLSLIEE